MSSRGFIRNSRTYPRSRDAVAHLSLTSGVKTSKPETSVGERCDEIQKTTHNSVAEASAYTNECFVPENQRKFAHHAGGGVGQSRKRIRPMVAMSRACLTQTR